VIADDNKKSINQAIERVKSIGEAKSIGQMFDNYKHLQRLHIGTHDDLDTREEETQLSQLQNSGFKTLLERIKRELAKCDLLINKLDEYNQRKNVLQQLQVFMPISEEFNDIYHEKEVAAKNLEKRYEEFLTRGKINKIIKQVNDLSVSMNSTIRNCEENLQKIHKFSAELTELSKQNNNLTIDYSEINKKIKEFDNQIAKQCEELTRLQNRIEAIADPNELDKFKIDYAKIEYIFKDSSHYANYQQFQTKIDELDDVLDIVRVLEKEIKQKSNSINECQKSQQTLAEKSKDVPDRFQPQIQAINQYLSDRLEQYRHELDDLEQRLTTITGLKQCQSLEAELSRKSNYYLGSEIDEDRYRLIQSQLSRLQELYKLADAANRQTLEDYNQHLQALQQWLDEDSQIPEWMGDRYSAIRRDTEKNRQALLDKIRKDAREWVNQVAVVESGINTDSNLERQAEDAHKLIQRIQNEKPIHILGLTEDLENTIKEIEQKCNSIIDSNLEIQIISRFRQLPQSRRNVLYTKMQDYLTDKTEDY
jgi:DNA repair exonuclease SbcCD ATPase subunit